MGTYISFPRTCGTPIRLSLLLIAISCITLLKASALPDAGVHTEFAADGADHVTVATRGVIEGRRPASYIGRSEVWLLNAGRERSDTAVVGVLPHRQRHHAAGGANQREYFLYNSCSRRHVRLLGHSVDAAGGRDDDMARLVMENVGNNLVHIRRLHSSLYLCFSSKGSLVTQMEPSELCLFNETLADNQHTELRLAAHSAGDVGAASMEWLVGFKKSGEPWKGYEHKRGRSRKCFQFTKRHKGRLTDNASGIGALLPMAREERGQSAYSPSAAGDT